MKGGNVDYTKTAKIILDDFRSGRLGTITLEHPIGSTDDAPNGSEDTAESKEG